MTYFLFRNAFCISFPLNTDANAILTQLHIKKKTQGNILSLEPPLFYSVALHSGYVGGVPRRVVVVTGVAKGVHFCCTPKTTEEYTFDLTKSPTFMGTIFNRDKWKDSAPSHTTTTTTKHASSPHVPMSILHNLWNAKDGRQKSVAASS
eukprot:GEMP01106237.1.p1 GENE.GEMP01106237.1~~GEMP01106237.1.p1  ORF type:complete len:149 (+),score=10.33 GEMP01106237.1:192-638(+)